MLLSRDTFYCAGVVNGLQSSLQSLLQSFSYLMGLFVWQPERFEWLMAGSVGVVAVATALFRWFLATQVDFAAASSITNNAHGSLQPMASNTEQR